MAIDIVNLAKNAVSEQILEQLGGVLGESPEKASAAFGAAVPVILGGMSRQAAMPGGAESLEQAVAHHNEGMLGNLGDLLSQGPTSPIFQSGGAMLGNLFGGNLSNIVQAMASSVGISEASVGKILAFAGPVILSVLGQQAKQAGPSAGGIRGLLASQKDGIFKMIPEELSSQLDVANLVSSVSSVADRVGVETPTASPSSKQSSGSLTKILIPLLVIGGLGFLGWRAIQPAESEESDDGGIAVELGDGESFGIEIPSTDEGDENATAE